MWDEAERRAALLGAIVGAVSGAAMGVLYQRWKRGQRMRGAAPINAKQVVRLGTAIATVLRRFVELIS